MYVGLESVERRYTVPFGLKLAWAFTLETSRYDNVTLSLIFVLGFFFTYSGL